MQTLKKLHECIQRLLLTINKYFFRCSARLEATYLSYDAICSHRHVHVLRHRHRLLSAFNSFNCCRSLTADKNSTQRFEREHVVLLSG